MPLYKFGPNDVYYNTIKAHPSCSFYIYDGEVYYNNRTAISGAFVNGHSGIGRTGFINLHELNIDRKEDRLDYDGNLNFVGNDGNKFRVEDKGLIYPYTIKQGDQSDAFKTISADQFTNIYEIGDVMSGSYRLSASISRELYPVNHATTLTTTNDAINSLYTTDQLPIEEHTRLLGGRIIGSRIEALRSRLDFNSIHSTHYKYKTAEPGGDNWDKSKQYVNLISIPSIFYGSGIKKGSVSLKYFNSGTLVGELRDINHNGELIQVSPSEPGNSEGSGSVAGVVMYNEGFMMLTGSWTLKLSGSLTPLGGTPAIIDRDRFGSTRMLVQSWRNFGFGAGPEIPNRSAPSSSWSMDFLGTSHVSTVSMMAHAKRGELNWSNNPTFISSSASSSYVSPKAGSHRYFERELEIKNIVSSSVSTPTGSFQKTTYISKIGIYDKDKKLIAVASVANPVKKTEERDLTFKLKLDI